MSEERKGTVIWFDPKPGYGFIEWDGQEETEEDMFVHFSDINLEGFKTLKKGQRVSFGVGKNNKGEPKAIDVTILDEEK